jgi:hypothetical protein
VVLEAEVAPAGRLAEHGEVVDRGVEDLLTVRRLAKITYPIGRLRGWKKRGERDAETIDDAIRLHSGRASASALRYVQLSAREWRQLEAFLLSLAAPGPEAEP